MIILLVTLYVLLSVRLIINPLASSAEDLEKFEFLGVLLGISIRSKKPLDLHLAPTVWKQICGIPLTEADIEEVLITML